MYISDHRTADNHNTLFVGSCVALCVTAMTFGIRAGILNDLSQSFGFSDAELGWINSMAFLGFPIAMLLGGLLYNSVGPKKMILVAFAGHLIGLLLTIFATGFWSLLISTFFIGLANGGVEAACNPLIAGIYNRNKTTMLNRFHVWFPAGIVIGALVSKGFTELGWSWQAQIAVMILPTLFYGFLMWRAVFPQSTALVQSTSQNIRGLMTPLFIFMTLCMTLTATSELGTQQWIERILGASGASPMLVLALITGLMAVGRYFAGPIVHRLNPVGVLWFSAIMTTIGIYWMSFASGWMVYAAGAVFALGVTYFWPTMVGFIAEYMPNTGALGMSVIGGAGIFAVSIWSPVIGGWIDASRELANAQNLSGVSADLVAGQATLSKLMFFPLSLVILFGCLWFFYGRLTPKEEV